MTDTIKHLPSDQAERKRLYKVVLELVNLKLREEDIKGQIRDIYSVEKEDHATDPKMLKFFVDIEYDYLYNSSKKAADIEEKAERLSELDILRTSV
jgi:hypothetical protein